MYYHLGEDPYDEGYEPTILFQGEIIERLYELYRQFTQVGLKIRTWDDNGCCTRFSVALTPEGASIRSEMWQLLQGNFSQHLKIPSEEEVVKEDVVFRVERREIRSVPQP